jgi:soluble lytic murein transglycosylase-like protein
MRLTAVAFILLACGVVYELKSPLSKHLHRPTGMSSQMPRIWPKVKRFVDVSAIIHAAAAKHNISAAIVKSIVAAESNFDPHALSPTGAIGLMQLMPATAHEYGADPTVPEQNVDAGTQYLGRLLKRYARHRNGLSRAIAAYNAGPGVVDRCHGIPPYRETRTYVARVLGFLRQYRKEHIREARASR